MKKGQGEEGVKQGRGEEVKQGRGEEGDEWCGEEGVKQGRGGGGGETRARRGGCVCVCVKQSVQCNKAGVGTPPHCPRTHTAPLHSAGTGKGSSDSLCRPDR